MLRPTIGSIHIYPSDKTFIVFDNPNRNMWGPSGPRKTLTGLSDLQPQPLGYKNPPFTTYPRPHTTLITRSPWDSGTQRYYL